MLLLLLLQLIKEKLLDLLGKEEDEGSHDENVVRAIPGLGWELLGSLWLVWQYESRHCDQTGKMRLTVHLSTACDALSVPKSKDTPTTPYPKGQWVSDPSRVLLGPVQLFLGHGPTFLIPQPGESKRGPRRSTFSFSEYGKVQPEHCQYLLRLKRTQNMGLYEVSRSNNAHGTCGAALS